MDSKNVVIALVMGLIAGWLASWVVGGGGLVQYVVSGVIGSFVGSYILGKAGINIGIGNEYVRDVVTATIGAVVVVIVARMIS